MMKEKQKGFLNYTRKEKNGALAVLLVVLLVIIGSYLNSIIFKDRPIAAADYKGAIDSLKVLKTDSNKSFYKNNSGNSNNYYRNDRPDFNNISKGELFYFDPNTLPVTDWMRLGVKEKIANNIQKYLSKGGKFRQPDDLKKIWGLRPEFVERILPYVRIAAIASSYENKTYSSYEKKVYEKKIVQPIDINRADSLAYIDLPGIGPSFAKRIINFRNRLGGFHNVDQVAETFGLPDSTFQKIKPYLQIADAPLKKININSATLDELKAHPYIRYQLANLIVQYKTQHGPYKRIDDIKKIMVVDDETFNKIAPYLVAE